MPRYNNYPDYGSYPPPGQQYPDRSYPSNYYDDRTTQRDYYYPPPAPGDVWTDAYHVPYNPSPVLSGYDYRRTHEPHHAEPRQRFLDSHRSSSRSHTETARVGYNRDKIESRRTRETNDRDRDGDDRHRYKGSTSKYRETTHKSSKKRDNAEKSSRFSAEEESRLPSLNTSCSTLGAELRNRAKRRTESSRLRDDDRDGRPSSNRNSLSPDTVDRRHLKKNYVEKLTPSLDSGNPAPQDLSSDGERSESMSPMEVKKFKYGSPKYENKPSSTRKLKSVLDRLTPDESDQRRSGSKTRTYPDDVSKNITLETVKYATSLAAELEKRKLARAVESKSKRDSALNSTKTPTVDRLKECSSTVLQEKSNFSDKSSSYGDSPSPYEDFSPYWSHDEPTNLKAEDDRLHPTPSGHDSQKEKSQTTSHTSNAFSSTSSVAKNSLHTGFTIANEFEKSLASEEQRTNPKSSTQSSNNQKEMNKLIIPKGRILKRELLSSKKKKVPTATLR